jgi:hypothetical protein
MLLLVAAMVKYLGTNSVLALAGPIATDLGPATPTSFHHPRAGNNPPDRPPLSD